MRQKPPTADEHFVSLERRVSAVESNRRFGFTSFDEGFVKIVGALAEVRFVPPDSTYLSSFSSIFSFYYGSNNAGAVLQMDNERIDIAGNFFQEGGKVQLFTDGAVLSFLREFSGLPEAYLWLGAQGVATIEMKGRFPEIQADGEQAVLAGTSDLGAGFGSFTYTYFTAFVSTAVPIVTILNSGGVITWNLTAQSTSSWTVTWSGTAAKTINYWIFRGE